MNRPASATCETCLSEITFSDPESLVGRTIRCALCNTRSVVRRVEQSAWSTLPQQYWLDSSPYLEKNEEEMFEPPKVDLMPPKIEDILRRRRGMSE